MKEETINLYGKTYKQLTYENGEQILKRYDDKSKMWVKLKFKQSDDVDAISLIKETPKMPF